MSHLLWRAGLRHLPRHPWQLGLAVLGISLGVAVVLAVDLAAGSARKSFALAMAQITGQASHQIVGAAGVPETLYVRLRLDLAPLPLAPVVTGVAAVAGQPGRRVQILGVDPFAEAPFRRDLAPAAIRTGDLAALLTEPDAALLPADLGERVELLAGTARFTLRAVGHLDPAAARELVVTDVATAQALIGRRGWLSHVDLILPEGAAGRHLAQRIAVILPPDLRLEPAAAHGQATAELSAAFELNLTALSLLALLVGMFLIYNTMTFSVVRRRALLGRLRALGVSRGEVFTLILGEALVLGLAGTLLGGLLGVWLGSALVYLVTRTIDDLYYVVTVREFHLVPLALLKAAALGLVATAAAAWLPAREAAGAPPATALSRAALEARRRERLPRRSWLALLLGVAGAAWLGLSESLIGGFGALFILVLACTLLAPAGVVLLGRLAESLIARRASLTTRMATRDVVRNLSRTGVAVAALMVAFAATVGMAVMVDSFRGGVALWLEDLLNADVYVTPLRLEGAAGAAPLEREVLEHLRRDPHVGAVATYRRRAVTLRTAVLDGRQVQLVAAELPAAARAGYRFRAGAAAEAWRAFREAGAVIVTEPLAYRHDLKPGAGVTLDTERGRRTLVVAGVVYDYGSEHGRILMHRETYQTLWTDRAVDSAGVYAAPGTAPGPLQRHLEAAVGTLQPLAIRSNRELREASLAIFDRTFTITEVLRLLAIAVAMVGMLSALLALQLERARELAMLRAMGMTPAEIGRQIALGSGLLGLAAGLFAIPVGIGLATLLIFVIQRRAFGWTLPLAVDPWILVQAVLLAVLAALLAGLYPILRMARTPPAAALRSE